MNIQRSIDIEYAVKQALDAHITAYVRPLPATYDLPHVEITQVGGSDSNQIDTFDVVLDARAEDEATASETLRNAIGVLKAVTADSNTEIRNVIVNSSGSWGRDAVRPELALCSARVRITAHLENTTI